MRRVEWPCGLGMLDTEDMEIELREPVGNKRRPHSDQKSSERERIETSRPGSRRSWDFETGKGVC